MVDSSTLSRIRELKRAGQSLREIGAQVGLSQTTVWQLTHDIPSKARSGRPRTLEDRYCSDCRKLLPRRTNAPTRCHACHSARRSRVSGDQARCSRCEQWKPLAEFSPSRANTFGIRAWCKPCESAANSERFKADPTKSYARIAVLRALRNGRMTKQPCEVCGTTERVQGHHDDYSKPLDVRWLCAAHHLAFHRAA